MTNAIRSKENKQTVIHKLEKGIHEFRIQFATQKNKVRAADRSISHVEVLDKNMAYDKWLDLKNKTRP